MKSELIINCSDSLKEFSTEFVEYYNKNIDRIKEILNINENTKIIATLTDDVEKAGFVYGKSSFSGFFNDNGIFAYIDLNENTNKYYIFKCLMHEIVHHLYKFYVYGKEKERITWVDEGLAQFLSGEKDDLKELEKYRLFLSKNLDNCVNNNDLNKLNHKDLTFGKNNGYNLSYIAIRYLYENNSNTEFNEIIRNKDKLLEIGSSIIKKM